MWMMPTQLQGKNRRSAYGEVARITFLTSEEIRSSDLMTIPAFSE
jgi:hypothetical protein